MGKMNGKTWIAAIMVVVMICIAFSGFIWRVWAVGAEADIRIIDKVDILDSRTDNMESKYAEVNTSLKYIGEDIQEQKVMTQKILEKLENGGS